MKELTSLLFTITIILLSCIKNSESPNLNNTFKNENDLMIINDIESLNEYNMIKDENNVADIGDNLKIENLIQEESSENIITDSLQNYENSIIAKEYDAVNYIENDDIKNGAVIEIIESGGKEWTVRKLTGVLSLQGWREDIVDILDNPRGNTIYKVKLKPKPLYDQVHLLAITKETDTIDGIEWEGIPYEDHWVKILIDDDKSGWIFGTKLGVERGGPKYLTSENVEYSVLQGNKEFEKYYFKENVMN
jgi:hypothetical protein